MSQGKKMLNITPDKGILEWRHEFYHDFLSDTLILMTEDLKQNHKSCKIGQWIFTVHFLKGVAKIFYRKLRGGVDTGNTEIINNHKP